MEKNNVYLLFLVLLLLFSCSDSDSLKTKDDIMSVKKINGYVFEVFKVSDSIENKNTTAIQTIHLCLQISPDTSAGYKTDVVTQRVGSVEEMNKRIENLNFNIADDFYISRDNKFIYPLISHMENTYGLEKSRLIHFVFSDTLYQKGLNKQTEDTLLVIWQDKIYGTGKNYFRLVNNK